MTSNTHSVAINLYPATATMPQLSIVVVDTIPVELKRSYMVRAFHHYCAAADYCCQHRLLFHESRCF
jgi:two-component system sensor histidine kinase PhoQ